MLESQRNADLATKSDLHEVRSELKLEIEGVKGELELIQWMLALVVVAEVLPFLSKLFN